MQELVKTLGAQVSGNISTEFVPEVSTDTRNVKANNMFVAICGENFDGHKFVQEAIKKGVKIIVVNDKFNDSEFKDKASFIKLPDTLDALASIAKLILSKSKAKIIGLTGSTGKTTTREMIKNILSTKYKVQGSPVNFNNLIRVPVTIFNLDESTEFLVLEMGTNKFGEIAKLCEIAKPDFSLITNIGKSHTEFLEDEVGVLKEKRAIFDVLNEDDTAIINMDDPRLAKIVNQIKARNIYFGESKECHVKVASSQRKDTLQTEITFDVEGKKIKTNIPLIGDYNIKNALAATATAYACGIDLDNIAKGLEKNIDIKMRSKIIKLSKNKLLVDDCYNANPVSMRASLNTLKELGGPNSTLAILGDMFELGATKEKEHLALGEFIDNLGIHQLIAVGPLAKFIFKGFDNKNALHFESFEKAKDTILEKTNENDFILVKASRGMKFERIVEIILKNFKPSR